MSFAISSLALFFLQEYNVIVSSKSSGGEHDSTGLGAKHKLITPLLRCASPETATLYSELFETTQQNKKGSPRLPFLCFRRGRKPGSRQRWVQKLRPSIVEYDVRVGAKLCCGGAASPSADDGAGLLQTKYSRSSAVADFQGVRLSGVADFQGVRLLNLDFAFACRDGS